MPRLISINNYFYRRGGSETVFFEHNRLFEQAGWDVMPFSMQHPQNLPNEWSKDFVSDSSREESASLGGKLLRAANAIYSFEAASKIRAVIRARRPDIAHAHNIYHQLSPSVLVELHRQDIPVVLTLHDLKLACPAYKMYAHGQVCERCRGGALRNVVTQRCIKDSTAMSALVWLESSLHKMFDVYNKTVTQFIVPSRFFLAKFAEWGIDTTRFNYVPNSVDVEAFVPQGEPGNAFVYCGRLVPEKGVDSLIRAVARAQVALRIVGTGPEEPRLRQLAAELDANVEFVGYLSGPALQAAISTARAVVAPSEWYENAPLSILEANALARPVVGADIGGISELIKHNETGFVYPARNLDALTEVLLRVQQLSTATLSRMGQAARDWMRTEFSPSAYRERMISVYRKNGVALNSDPAGAMAVLV